MTPRPRAIRDGEVRIDDVAFSDAYGVRAEDAAFARRVLSSSVRIELLRLAGLGETTMTKKRIKIELAQLPKRERATELLDMVADVGTAIRLCATARTAAVYRAPGR